MELTEEIKITKIQKSHREEISNQTPGFGNVIADHMFRSLFKHQHWNHQEILPFSNLSLSPATLALHYGQSIFEGMKAFRLEDGRIQIFRLEKHHERINKSLYRMCMPEIPFSLFANALSSLVSLDKAWIPPAPGALYLRPFVFASEEKFGVKVAEEYCFIIFSGPVDAYYPKPIKVKVEREFIRAARGGTGYAKCSGNYGGAFLPTHLARQQGFDQILWTDARENEYIEESGTMNAFFVLDGKIVTPPLSDTILDGVTRDCLITLARELQLPVVERPVGVTELLEAFRDKRISEAFGAGTAAVIAPIASVYIDGNDYFLPTYSEKSIMFRLKNKLDAIRYGKENDFMNWNYIL
ncbi:MAG: branched-chain amino acid aminotransferase [Flavisolibacter sp.]